MCLNDPQNIIARMKRAQLLIRRWANIADELLRKEQEQKKTNYDLLVKILMKKNWKKNYISCEIKTSSLESTPI